VISGASEPRPTPQWEGATMRDLVRKYPNGGFCLERALTDALRLGFAAGHLAGSEDGAAASLPASDFTSETDHA
jgi:hypothetical protein